MPSSILLVAKDAPTTDRRKAGLFPSTIRHHVSIFSETLLYCTDDNTGEMSSDLHHISGLHYLNPEVRRRFWHPSRSTKIMRFLKEREVAKLAKQKRVGAVVSLQSAPRSGLCAARLAKEIGVPYASWEHLSGYGREDEVKMNDSELRNFFSKASAIAAVSTPTINAIEKRFSLRLQKATTIPNPVPADFEFLESPENNKFTPKLESGIIFGGWTNWRSIKRLDLLIDAFTLACKQISNARLVIAGPVETRIKEMLVSHPLADRINLLGDLSRDDIFHLAHAVDCCCVTSDHETFGLPIVEAIAAGKPVISTDADGPLEILGSHPEIGELVPKGDTAAFASAMCRIASNLASYDKNLIKEIAIAHYGQSIQVKRWREFYQNLGLSV